MVPGGRFLAYWEFVGFNFVCLLNDNFLKIFRLALFTVYTSEAECFITKDFFPT